MSSKRVLPRLQILLPSGMGHSLFLRRLDRRSFGVLDHSNQFFNIIAPLPYLSPGRSWGQQLASRGFVVASLWLSHRRSMSGAAFLSHPEGFLGLHVGSCWGHFGLGYPQVGAKMAQHRCLLAQVGSKTTKMDLKGFPSSPR